MIGDVRTAILLGLDRPLTMTRLSVLLQYAPNVVTYHCNRLETAGLVTRQRCGRRIYVQRTDKATALLDLFA
jgi:DNA-binding MarR family transcriptional regulator